MSVRSTEARNPHAPRPQGRGAHMISRATSRAALTDIDEEILREYRDSISALHSSSLLQYDYIEGGTRRAPCPSLSDLDEMDIDGARAEFPLYLPRRKYART